MHYLKVTALATALAALASTSPLPDNAIVRRDRAVVEGADPLDSDRLPYRKEKRDRAIVEGADPLDSDTQVYRKEKRGTYAKYENNGPYVPMSDEMEA